jgi:hypothetical protein
MTGVIIIGILATVLWLGYLISLLKAWIYKNIIEVNKNFYKDLEEKSKDDTQKCYKSGDKCNNYCGSLVAGKDQCETQCLGCAGFDRICNE